MPLYDMPNMGMNYGQLAQLMRPQMRPEAPLGAGGVAGAAYARDNQRYQQMLQQAAAQAEMDAQLRAQAAGEYAAAGPGRLATINKNNALAEGEQAMIPDLLMQRQGEVQGQLRDQNNKSLQSELKILSEFAEEYMQAPDKEGKQEVVERIKSAGITKVGNRSIDEIQSSGRMDALMQRLYDKATKTPNHRQKLELENTKQTGANLRSERAAKAKAIVAKIAADVRLRLSEQNKGKPGNWQNQMYAEIMADAALAAGGDKEQLAANIQEARSFMVKLQLAGSTATQQNRPNQTDVNFKTGEVTQRPPVTPVAPTPPKFTPATPSTGIKKFNSAEEVRDAFRNKQLTREQAKKELEAFGYTN